MTDWSQFQRPRFAPPKTVVPTVITASIGAGPATVEAEFTVGVTAKADGTLSFAYKTKPRDAQARAVELALTRVGTGIFHQMGYGKSKCVVDIVYNGNHRRTLIVCPKAVLAVWPYQFDQHAITMPKMLVLDEGTTAQKAAQVAEFGDGVVVVNYSSATYGFGGVGKLAGLTKALYQWGPDCVVADEAHALKCATSKQSKMLWDLGRQKFVTRRLALTGTPFHHAPEDIFGQMRFVDDSILGQYITHFRRKWMYQPVPDKIPNKWLFRPDMRAELERVVGAASITGLTRDAVDLPPVQDIEVPLTLEPAAYRAYQRLKDEFIAELDAGIVTAANAAVKSGKLRQITGGAVFGEDGNGDRITLSVPSPKAEALETLLDGIGESERVVVFSSFRSDVAAVQKAAHGAGRRCFVLNGERNELKEWYGHEGAVLAINIQSGGAGIDLSCASYGVFWNHGTSRGNYEQARARLDRPGQKGQQVTFWHLLCTGTLDVAVYRAMKSGGELAAAMMAAMRDGRK